METDEQLGRYLSFSLGQEEYGIPLLSVKEVVAVPEITPIPFTPTYFLGIMSLRGQVISVIDLRSKLNIKPNTSAETAIVICELNSIFLGVVVDSVNSVITPKGDDLSPKPEIHGNKNTDYITNVYRKEKRLILFLDITKVLNSEDHSQISKSASKAKAA
jgi:purine-binding chemotaxis protein CheW